MNEEDIRRIVREEIQRTSGVPEVSREDQWVERFQALLEEATAEGFKVDFDWWPGEPLKPVVYRPYVSGENQ